MRYAILAMAVLLSTSAFAGGRLGPHPGTSPPEGRRAGPHPSQTPPPVVQPKPPTTAKLEVAPYGINEQGPQPDKIDRMILPRPSTPPPPPPKA